jgi:signal peptidase I
VAEAHHDTPPDDEPPEGLREFLVTWGPPILAVILIRLFLFEPFRIPSGSMVPTLLIGDHVLVTKFSYGVWVPFKGIGVPLTSIGLDDIGLDLENLEVLDLGDPERGDIIVFHYPMDEDVTYIKRVIGLPGDTIQVVDNQVVLDAVPQERVNLGDYDDADATCRIRKARLYAERLTQSNGEVLTHGKLTNRAYGGPLSNRAQLKVPPEHVFVMGDNRDHSEDSRRWGFVHFNQIKGKAHFTWLSWDGCAGGPRLERMFRSLYSTEGLEGPAVAE